MLAAASVLSTFDLLRKVHDNGRKIGPKGKRSGSVSFTLGFGFMFFVFTCRLQSAMQLSLRDQAEVPLHCGTNPLFLWARLF